MTASAPHGIFNCVIGAAQAGPTLGIGETVLNFFGANLTPGSVASALTIASNVAMTAILMTLGAPASGGTAPGNLPTFSAVNGGALFYTLSGTGATAQIYSQAG